MYKKQDVCSYILLFRFFTSNLAKITYVSLYGQNREIHSSFKIDLSASIFGPSTQLPRGFPPTLLEDGSHDLEVHIGYRWIKLADGRRQHGNSDGNK